jgi:hypothetical protein
MIFPLQINAPSSQFFPEVFMTGFELVSVAVAVAGVVVGFFAVPAFILMWAQSTEAHKASFWRLVAKLRRKAYRGWVYVSCLVLVATGVIKVVGFATSSEPLTRIDVLLLLLNVMSFFVFLAVSILLFVYFQIEDKKKHEPSSSD